ncbi:MAG: hypothetical protein ACSHXF_16910 [Aquaticitalea sp.]
MKRYSIDQIEILDWNIVWNEVRMLCYNINATRISGHEIGMEWVFETDGEKRITTDIANFELNQNRASSYWNKVFVNLLKLNKIPFYNNINRDKIENDNFSWEIEILEFIYLTFDLNNSEILLKQNSELLFFKKWQEFDGNDFYELIKKINFRF